MSEQSKQGRFTAYLDRSPSPIFVAYAVFAAFTTYFCMYAFRKPFAAAKFDGIFLFDSAIKLKTAIVVSQIMGYALSKFIGIIVCSEITPRRRAIALVLLILVAEASLIVYGLVPDNYKIFIIFFNGLPLGMVWGLVVWYLEGRRTSELLLAGLSCSFIVASGIVKDIGRAMMAGGVAEWWAKVPLIGAPIASAMGEVSEGWMPALVGLHFLPLFLLSVWLLNQLPQPTEADIEARVEREPMNRELRAAFVKKFLFGIVLLCVAYFFMTAYRDFRDNFQVEIFDALGYKYDENKSIISKAETIVAFGVLGALALLNLIKDNRRGLMGAYAIMVGGLVLMTASSILRAAGLVNGFWWMTLVGLGSYLAYVPYGSVLFDRLIASTRAVGTAVFAIYILDAIGYTGAISVLLFKDIAASKLSLFSFFEGFTYFMSILGAVCLVISCVYFLRQDKRPTDPTSLEAPRSG